MEQFNLDKWLKDKSRKVTTRLGNREVRIICWDRKNNSNRPVITLMIDPDGNEYTTFHTKNGFVDEKEKYIDKRDLFFAEEEEELTEFEKAMINIVFKYKYWSNSKDEVKQYIKKDSKPLLDLAIKEILKDLPKWKKAEKDEELDCHVAIQQDGMVVLSDFVQKDEYYITLDVLKRLPKEE